MSEDKNLAGGPLRSCSTHPLTGFFRDGCCSTGPQDVGSHTVCTVMTAEFLEFTKSRGNDLSTPNPEYGFPGLKPGDRWCVCAARWQEAFDAGVIGPVVLDATNEAAAGIASGDDLLSAATDITPPTNRLS